MFQGSHEKGFKCNILFIQHVKFIPLWSIIDLVACLIRSAHLVYYARALFVVIYYWPLHLDEGGGQVSRPSHLRWRRGSDFLTFIPLAKARVGFLDLHTSGEDMGWTYTPRVKAGGRTSLLRAMVGGGLPDLHALFIFINIKKYLFIFIYL